MSNALRMHIADPANQLCKVEMCNIFFYPDVRFDFVEQVPSLCILHGNPFPYRILAGGKPFNNIRVLPNVRMKGYLHGDLFGRYSSMFDCVRFVDEFHCKYWSRFSRRNSLFNAISQSVTHFLFLVIAASNKYSYGLTMRMHLCL
jgi:hypothetical protein